MSEKLYEIHIIEKRRCAPRFYVIDRRNGERYPDCQWPPNFKQLGCDYVNEHSEFIVDGCGYAPEYVKCYFVEIRGLIPDMHILVELTEEGEKLEMQKYREKLMYEPFAFGLYPEPTFFHPKKK